MAMNLVEQIIESRGRMPTLQSRGPSAGLPIFRLWFCPTAAVVFLSPRRRGQSGPWRGTRDGGHGAEYLLAEEQDLSSSAGRTEL